MIIPGEEVRFLPVSADEMKFLLRLVFSAEMSREDAAGVANWLYAMASSTSEVAETPIDGCAFMAEAMEALAVAFNHPENQEQPKT